jgi:hypothetical protein
MSDILDGARELRQKLYYLEVLLEIDKGERGRSWFTGKGPDASARAAAIKRLAEKGLVEAAEAPAHYKLTADGHEFVQDLRAKVGSGRALDWTHADEIDFSRL